MKYILASILLSTAPGTYAQIQVTSQDMPLVNDTVRYSTSLTNVSQATLDDEAGANKTWNYSRLVPDWQDMAQFKSPSGLGHFAFGASTFGAKDNDFNFSLPGGGGATDVYNYYSKSTSAFAMDGRGFSFQGLPLPQLYLPKDIIYRFPLTYGKRDSSSFTSTPVDIVVASLRSGGKRTNHVDGWGTLVTPFGSYNCLRVKSIVRDTDYITITGLPFALPIPRVSTEYKWLAKGMKIPILEISVPAGGGDPVIKYRDLNRPWIFAPLASFTSNKTKFNAELKDTCILTNTSDRNPNSVEWTITPASYYFTGGTNATSPAAKIFFNTEGTYTVTLKVKYNAGSDDTTIVDYITVTGNNSIAELLTAQQVSIFPNPARNSFNVSIPNKLISNIRLYDIAGREVEISSTTGMNSMLVDCATLSKGIYTIKVVVTGGQSVSKVLAIE